MQRTRLDWRRRLTTLALGTAAHLRHRAEALTPPPAPVAEIVADPEQVASDHLLAAYRALHSADPGASQSQLFTKLRLMFNKLEHGGLRRAPAPPRADNPTVGEQVFAQDWFGNLRSRGRLLRGALRRLSE